MGSKNQYVLRSLFFVTSILLLLLVIAGGAETSAAPSMQGTVPTRSRSTPIVPPAPASTDTSSSPPGPNSSNGSTNPSSNPPSSNPTPAGLSAFTCAVGGGDLNCTSQDGALTIYFPPGSVPVGTRATIAPVVDCPSPVIPPEYTFLGPCYDITVIGSDGKQVTVFTPPLKLMISFTAQEVAKAGGDANRLSILFYDRAGGFWTTKDLSDRRVDLTQQVVSITVPHFSTYALFFENGTNGSASGPGAFLNGLWELLRRFIGSGQ